MYIRDHLQFITEQPRKRQDVVPSILEHNLSAYAEEKEREEEWSKIGVDSGVNPLEYKRRKQDGKLAHSPPHTAVSAHCSY
jgi:polyhydroxyalkanoate synthesis regulator protein